MPGGDRTGPLGEGPLTGRRMGFCAGEDQAGYMFNTGFGFRRGRGQKTRFERGYNRNWGTSRFAPSENIQSTSVHHIDVLANEFSDLIQKLNQVLDGFNNLIHKSKATNKVKGVTKK